MGEKEIFKSIQSQLPVGVWLLYVHQLPSVDDYNFLPMKFYVQTNIGDFTVESAPFWDILAMNRFKFVFDVMDRIYKAIMDGYYAQQRCPDCSDQGQAARQD